MFVRRAAATHFETCGAGISRSVRGQEPISLGRSIGPGAPHWINLSVGAALKTVQINREHAFKQQKGRCFYCGQPMWQQDPVAFARQYGLRVKQVRPLQVTAEHVVARSAGGGNRRSNIVAACRFCNAKRHQTTRPLEADEYGEWVRRRLAQGKWHRLHLESGVDSGQIGAIHAPCVTAIE